MESADDRDSPTMGSLASSLSSPSGKLNGVLHALSILLALISIVIAALVASGDIHNNDNLSKQYTVYCHLLLT